MWSGASSESPLQLRISQIQVRPSSGNRATFARAALVDAVGTVHGHIRFEYVAQRRLVRHKRSSRRPHRGERGLRTVGTAYFERKIASRIIHPTIPTYRFVTALILNPARVDPSKEIVAQPEGPIAVRRP